MVDANFLQVVPGVLQEHGLFLYQIYMFLGGFPTVRPLVVAAAVDAPANMAELLLHIVVYFIARLWHSSARTLCKSNVFCVRRRHAPVFSIN